MASTVIRHFIKVGGMLWNWKKHVEMDKIGRGVRISYGYYCVENQDGSEGCVVAQKVEIDSMSIRLFGVFDEQMEALHTGDLQSHLSSTKNLNESKVRRSAKEAIKNAYKNRGQSWEMATAGVKMEGLQLCFCRVVGRLSWRILLDLESYYAKAVRQLRLAQSSLCQTESERVRNESKLVITTRNLEPDTGFIILASTGIWEAVGYQEAVHLVGHIEDAQKAAECLAEEAITRFSKSSISCLIIRFSQD